MNKRTLIPMLGIGTLLISGCNNSVPVTQNTPPTQNTQIVKQDAGKQSETKEKIEDHTMMEMPGELTPAESAKYTNDLALDKRIQLAEELAMKMPMNGMKQTMTMFPDLTKKMDVENENAGNLMKMGTETWYISKEANIAIVSCTETNGPIHVFKAMEPTLDEIAAAVKMMHEMPMGGAMEETKESGEYIDYSEETYNSLLGKKPLVLFFHANWCPTCRIMDKDIVSELKTFPAGTKILKTDFDKETELKKKYNVVGQSTIVVLNAKGEVVQKLVAPDNDAIKAAISNSLL